MKTHKIDINSHNINLFKADKQFYATFKNLLTMTTRDSLINHIHSINQPLSKEWLSKQSDEILLANCHPIYSKDFAYDLEHVKIVTILRINNYKTYDKWKQ